MRIRTRSRIRRMRLRLRSNTCTNTQNNHTIITKPRMLIRLRTIPTSIRLIRHILNTSTTSQYREMYDAHAPTTTMISTHIMVRAMVYKKMVRHTGNRDSTTATNHTISTTSKNATTTDDAETIASNRTIIHNRTNTTTTRISYTADTHNAN